MALRVKKKKKPQTELQSSAKLKVYDIPVGEIFENPDNPNEQDDKTFDLLVEKIKTLGFDEPVIVAPRDEGGYEIVSGHHRFKAAKVLKYEAVPCVVHHDWDRKTRDIELVSRNQLKGQLNPEKFTRLYQKIVREGTDASMLKLEMGFTKEDAFKKVFKQVEQSLPAAERKKLNEAKESIKSVDDLSSVLNTIFKQAGSQLEQGYLVFSFGGKNHHYFQIDSELDKMLTAFQEKCVKDGKLPADAFKEFFRSQGIVAADKPKKKKLKKAA